MTAVPCRPATESNCRFFRIWQSLLSPLRNTDTSDNAVLRRPRGPQVAQEPPDSRSSGYFFPRRDAKMTPAVGLGTKILGISLFPLALGTAGLVSISLAFVLRLRLKQLLRKSQVARDSWLRVPARILYSRVEVSRDQYGPRPGMNMFSARFRYEYEIGGKSYEGTQYTMMKEWSSNHREPHDKEAAEFPEGQDVKVWVNPED